MTDPLFANVGLLLDFDVPAGTTPPDHSNSAHTVTFSGNAAIVATPTKFGAGALLCGTVTGGNNRASVAGTLTDFQFGAGQFTVEGWVRFTSVATTSKQGLLSQLNSRTSNFGWSFHRAQTTGNLTFEWSTSGTAAAGTVSGAWSPVVNTWYHVAADRDASNVLRVYVDGVVIASATVAATFFSSTSSLTLGCEASTTTNLAGHLDDVRITKGVARYGGAFAPPTTPFEGDTIPDARLTQLAAEVLHSGDPSLALTQLFIEVLRTPSAAYRWTPSGGLTFSGAADAALIETASVYIAPLPSGGIHFAGQADVVFYTDFIAPLPTGGIRFLGEADARFVREYVAPLPQGGLVFSGDAYAYKAVPHALAPPWRRAKFYAHLAERQASSPYIEDGRTSRVNVEHRVAFMAQENRRTFFASERRVAPSR